MEEGRELQLLIVNNNTIYLVDNERDENSASDFKGMMIKIVKELKEDIKIQFNEFQKNKKKKMKEKEATR
jgi:hypothetical protein